jgi:hypothetical protein
MKRSKLLLHERVFQSLTTTPTFYLVGDFFPKIEFMSFVSQSTPVDIFCPRPSHRIVRRRPLFILPSGQGRCGLESCAFSPQAFHCARYALTSDAIQRARASHEPPRTKVERYQPPEDSHKAGATITRKNLPAGKGGRFLSKNLDTVRKGAYSANSWKIRVSKCHVVSAASFDSRLLPLA